MIFSLIVLYKIDETKQKRDWVTSQNTFWYISYILLFCYKESFLQLCFFVACGLSKTPVAPYLAKDLDCCDNLDFSNMPALNQPDNKYEKENTIILPDVKGKLFYSPLSNCRNVTLIYFGKICTPLRSYWIVLRQLDFRIFWKKFQISFWKSSKRIDFELLCKVSYMANKSFQVIKIHAMYFVFCYRSMEYLSYVTLIVVRYGNWF